jgi:uncharacterized protein (TIGR03382 family)
MKTVLSIAAIAGVAAAANAGLIITGVVDGPLSGGTPKAIELYATADIADLSIYGIGSANNLGGTDGQEFALSGSATKGQFLYVASEAPNFLAFFGFAADFVSGAAAINGDDAIELFQNGSVIDVFGEISGPLTGWAYTDGWAYRNDNTGPDGATFNIANWSFSGIDALDGVSVNNGAVPFGTYVPTPGALALLGLGGLAAVRRRR